MEGAGVTAETEEAGHRNARRKIFEMFPGGSSLPERQGGHRWPVWVLVTVVMLWRLALPIRAGQFAGDESELAVRAGALLRGGTIPLLGLWGTRGVPYGPYPTYFYTFLYGLTGFHLGWSFLVLGLLFLASCFLLAASVRAYGSSTWTLLLALTSPVAIFFSMMLWDNPLLIVTSALTLYLAIRAPDTCWKPFGIGLVLGVSLAIHLMALPLVAGIFVWQVFVARRLKPALPLGVGIVIPLLPYLLGLWKVRDLLTPGFRRVVDPDIDLLSLPTSLFRFWGLHPFPPFANVGGTPLRLEEALGYLTLGITLVLIAMTCHVIWNSYIRSTLSRDSPLTALLIVAGFYLPFAFVTNSSHLLSHANAVWWFAPVVIPIVVRQVFPGRAGTTVLSSLVACNIVAAPVQWAPRMIVGTSAETINQWDYGLGASWWMQEGVARDIRTEADREVRSRRADLVLVKLADVKNINSSLPNLFKVKYPDDFSRIKWVPEYQKSCDIRVDPDAEHRYLRVTGRAAISWQLAGWQYRKAVVIENPGEELRDYQVSVLLKSDPLHEMGKLRADDRDLRVTDEIGQVLPHWVEPHRIEVPGDSGQPQSRIWIRVPVVSAGLTTLYLYFGNAEAENAQSGEKVFEWFDQFSGNAMARWDVVSGRAWVAGHGRCVNTDAGNDASAHRMLARGFTSESGVIEVRVTLTGAAGQGLDAGPAFRMVDPYNGYAVRMQADGIFSLRKISDGESAHVAYVFGVVDAKKGHIVKAVYRGSLLQAYLDGRLLIDTADHTHQGTGRIGVYKDRGGPEDQASFDWVFVRKYAQREPIATVRSE